MNASRMTIAELGAFLRAELPLMFRYESFTIEHADGRTCRIRQGFDETMLRPGGTISGPALMTLADAAMYIVLLSAIGPVGLAVTTNLSINFLRKAPRSEEHTSELQSRRDLVCR